MTQVPSESINMSKLIQSLDGIEVITDNAQVAKLSQDYHTFSPVLTQKLKGKVADFVIRPQTEEELIKAAKICTNFRVPVTVRGAGTGNYGQCVPLKGGAILDMSKMQDILWVKPGVARVQAGVKLASLDKKAREIGWEMRMSPSTYRTATIGGFVAGGSGGIGSVKYGLLSDRGNLLALKIVTMEDEPRIIELRGDDISSCNHAWGINGIITEIEIPLAAAYPWFEVIVTFPEFIKALRFGKALAIADGVVKKEVGIFASPIPEYFTALREYIPSSSHAALLIVSESALELLTSLVKEFDGEITYKQSTQDNHKGLPLLEYTWNHTTLHARTADSSITYLQSVFPDDDFQTVEHMYHHFGDEVMMHLEFIRTKGALATPGLQLVRYTTQERLNEIIRYHEKHGVFIANPHSYFIEEGWKRAIDPQHVEFKRKVDPYSLMNPGKSKTLGEK